MKMILKMMLPAILLLSPGIACAQQALVQTVIYATIAGTRWRLESEAFVSPALNNACVAFTPSSLGPHSLGTLGSNALNQANCVTINFTGLPSGAISNITISAQAREVDSNGNSLPYEAVAIAYDSTDQIVGENWRADKWTSRTSYLAGGDVSISGSLTLQMYVFDDSNVPAYAKPDTP